MKNIKLTVLIQLITVTLVFSILMATVNSVSAADKRGLWNDKTPPSPIEKAIPSWKDVARKHKKGLKLTTLPDLVAIAETVSNPCTIHLQIRNNSSFGGLTDEQWSSDDDAVRMEIWNLNGRVPELDDWHDMRFNEVDFSGNLRRPNSETLVYPWPIEPGLWRVVLIVDFASVIPEIGPVDNNTAEATTDCPATG